MTTPDYKALRKLAVQRDPALRLGGMDPAVRKARVKERNNRSSTAQSRAKTALASLHYDDYKSLYEQAMAEVNEERGPLPGDDA